MNKKSFFKKFIIILISLSVIFGLGYLPSFIGDIMHVKYLFSTPKDYWNDIVSDDFDFYTKGFTKTYDLNYKYFTHYTIDMVDKNKKLPYKINGEYYKFDGKIKVEYFSGNILIEEDYITKWITGGYSVVFKYMEYYKLSNFTIPINNQYKNLSIKLTVIQPMKYNPENKLKLSIGATLNE